MSLELDIDNVLLNDLRECRFYLNHLNNIVKFNSENIDFTSVMNMNHHIKMNIKLCCSNNKESIHLLLQDIKEKYKNELIKESDFDSLLTEDRANYYTWLSLKSEIQKGYIITNCKYPEINFKPSSFKNRSSCILSIIDGWPATKNIKLSIINNIKERFLIQSKEFKNPFKWIDRKNLKQCEFAYEYTINFFNETNNIQPNFIDYITPVTANEKYVSIIAIFDFWSTFVESKKLFLININKAWNQQKFREKVKDKKHALNTYINIDAKMNLDKLAIKHNKKINEMIEYLIYKELNEINNDNISESHH